LITEKALDFGTRSHQFVNNKLVLINKYEAERKKPFETCSDMSILRRPTASK